MCYMLTSRTLLQHFLQCNKILTKIIMLIKVLCFAKCCVGDEIPMPGDVSSEPEIVTSEGLCDPNSSKINDFVLVFKFDH